MIDMVIDASLQTARAESTADIYVITGFEEEGAELAYFSRPFDGRGEDQSICAGERVHDRREKA